MRKGSAIKSAIETTLRKTWVAANNGTNLDGLTVRFAGTGASMSEHPTSLGLRVVISLPDIKDEHAYSDTDADRILAYALHEIGHAFFTDSHSWDQAVEKEQDPLLHRCINAFDDVQQEAALIRSGYAFGAQRLLTGLVQHITKDCNAESFKRIDNLPFAACIDGRGYGVSVSHLVPQEHAALVAEAVAKAKALTCTADAVEAGVWLWNKLKQQQQQQQQQEQKSNSTSKKPSKGNASKQLDIEPKLDGLPLDATATIPDIAKAVDGEWSKAEERFPRPPIALPLGRLAYEIRTLLDNTSNDLSQRNLSSGRLSRQWAAVARGSVDVFQRRRIEDGIDSAVLVALDASGSMVSQGEEAPDAVRMFGEALKRCAGVVWSVATFNDMGWSKYGASAVFGKSELQRADWKVFKDFNEPVGKFYARQGVLSDICGGTPDIAAMRDALIRLSARPEKRKVLVWVGDGHGYNAKAAHALLNRYSDVTVIGIGINADLSKYFKHSVIISSPSKLASASFRAVAKALAA